MAKKKLSELELRLKKLGFLAKSYTDGVMAGERVNLIQQATPTSGYLKTYILARGVDQESEVIESGTGANLIGRIDIPKDYLVKSGKLLTVEQGTGAHASDLMVVKENGVAVAEPYVAPATITAAGEWMDFIINVKDQTQVTDEHISINLSTFIDVYSAGDGLALNNKKFSIDLATASGLELAGETADQRKLKIKIGTANGLSLDANGLNLATASPSTDGVGGSAGAMSAQDKENLDKLNIDLLSDAELGSWFGYASDSTMVTTTLPAVSDDSITDE